MILLGLNLCRFYRDLRERNSQYNRWLILEVDALSDVEKRCRTRKRPEPVRRCFALLGPFTVIEILYFGLAGTSVAMWVLYIRAKSELEAVLVPG